MGSRSSSACGPGYISIMNRMDFSSSTGSPIGPARP
jgi:hypothetical protein